MAQFLGDIAGMLAVLAIAAGLIVLHVGRKEGAGLLKAAGLVLLVGGIATGLCTSYYWLNYQQAGAFDEAYPQHGMDMQKMMQHMHQMMGPGGMMGMMHGGPGAKMGRGMPGRADESPAPQAGEGVAPEPVEEHHPQ